MKSILDRITRNFILNEGEGKDPSLEEYLKMLEETLEAFRMSSESGNRRLTLARIYLRKIRDGVYRLIKEKRDLDEQFKGRE